jgi:hypothetical protein
LPFTTAVIFGLSTISAYSSDIEEPDVMEFLVSSYTEVLLIGYACQDYGASGHPAIVERTINDFVELGMTVKTAAETVDGLIATEGPHLVEIIHEEAERTPQGAVLYCTTAYPAAVSKLDHARLAIAKVLRDADDNMEEK